ncbi:DUF669 domain-containing protein [Lacticaseibacillus saniviri]|uniref:Single stranded binding protein n=1 Tax=Lacticaseibacillus saniviri JCM 17471 = DSM 24301 TaxID=1293598 RepID=A0A0R2MR96_9LACO|nr:DUF669 domain-containing protein [Lacticaseibacillus saniviri]KRO16161.1 single stranded binding protein [Lacticaseibacillus saniviri JCM 17471 = DSM 24301]
MAEFNLTTDYSKNNEGNGYDPLPTGEYEVVINHVQEAATPSGAESLQFDLIVRNDLDAALPASNGKYHNRHVFVDNWKRKKTNQYDMDGLQYILEAAKIPEGTQINSIQDFMNALYHKPVNVYVKKENEEYNGSVTERNRVAPWNFKGTKYPQLAHQFKETSSAPTPAPTVTNSDLPF